MATGSEPQLLRYISLFSGIGVAELAIKRVFPNAECLGYAEVNADALLIYERHYPDHQNLGNVKHIDGAAFRGRVDLIIGGAPCQGFAKIGKKREFKDVRSRLFSEFVRLVRETKARYFVFENVRSMLPAIKQTISNELGVSPVTLDSSLFTPQVRRRLFWCNFPVYIPTEHVSPPLSDILIADHRMKDLTRNRFRGVAASTIVASRPHGASRVFALTTVGHYNAGMGSRNDSKANTVTTTLNDLQVIFDGKIMNIPVDCRGSEDGSV
ncbi:DNA (cytosine-5-)-methyltransferase [Powellomyces hirtus]|uniref:DNA (Cytosine-5-)-methyltransferase n=1 Tax=Powellomyces hirtus TaxID=109895 RepID=A0A507DSB2_9FUNG|nr:DNA (cytosine-5-)-methyltransferase [Powellomyces hirtus]